MWAIMALCIAWFILGFCAYPAIRIAVVELKKEMKDIELYRQKEKASADLFGDNSKA